MDNKLIFNSEAKCTKCGAIGAYDFTTSFLCEKCLPAGNTIIEHAATKCSDELAVAFFSEILPPDFTTVAYPIIKKHFSDFAVESSKSIEDRFETLFKVYGLPRDKEGLRNWCCVFAGKVPT